MRYLSRTPAIIRTVEFCEQISLAIKHSIFVTHPGNNIKLPTIYPHPLGRCVTQRSNSTANKRRTRCVYHMMRMALYYIYLLIYYVCIFILYICMCVVSVRLTHIPTDWTLNPKFAEMCDQLTHPLGRCC